MNRSSKTPLALLLIALLSCAAAESVAGPYSYPLGTKGPGDTPPIDPGVPGFVGIDGDGAANLNGANTHNYVNAAFAGWCSAATHYYRCDGGEGFSNPSAAEGPVSGDHANPVEVVSLGDLDQEAINAGDPPGSIVLLFDAPIFDGEGQDFAVFENGFVNISNAAFFAELAYVEVSSDGVDFLRFPSVSLTSSPVGEYGGLQGQNVYNLAGKHGNAYDKSWGTPFDLSSLTNSAACASYSDGVITTTYGATIDLNAITHIRIVDIPGSGDFYDEASSLTDPETGNPYPGHHPVYDAWHTWGSGGFDLDAVGAIHARGWHHIAVTFNKGGYIHPYGVPAGKVAVSNGADRAFSIQPDPHYHLEDLRVDGVSFGTNLTAYTFTNVVGDTHTLEADFAPDRHRLTVAIEGAGEVTPGGGSHAYGSVVALTASAGPYARFSHWSGDLPGGADPSNALCSVTVSNDMALVAHFACEGAATSNGVPVAWLDENGLDGDRETAAASDTDHDGWAAWQEYVAGTSPTNPTPTLFRVSGWTRDGTAGTLLFDTMRYREYIIYGSTDLNDWSETVRCYGTGEPAEIALPESGPPVYYRVQIGIP
ncbi:hypothetical protein L21SP4_02386 [Kiritimatiella glycovorans]|uniref:Bacterial repeat domain-containing protein n=2 Tax=Kiritimatiella glycovorans TaxID=1307763 RepID=A0A0G3EGL2_9BACT|nr:hypothetical protein L21SP4_02386 [Kiritimatiella glycovorans]